MRCSCQCPALLLTCKENTALRGCVAAANTLCYRRCAAAANALRCRAALPLSCKVTTALRRCAAAVMLPLPMHFAAELRFRCPARSPLCSSTVLQLPTPCAASLRCSALHCHQCTACRRQIDNNNKDNNHLRSQPTQMLCPPPPFLEQSKEEWRRYSYHDLGDKMESSQRFSWREDQTTMCRSHR